MSADIETLKTNLNVMFLLLNGSLIILMQEEIILFKSSKIIKNFTGGIRIP